MTRALVSTAALAAIAATGCGADWFIVGAQVHKTGAPAQATAIYTGQPCENMKGTGTKAVKDGDQIYLDLGSTPPSLYGLDATGNGVRFSNHWADAEGDHFFMYVKASIAEHFVFPRDPALPAVHYSYESGDWLAKEEGGVLKPLGAPTWKCPLVRKLSADELEQKRLAEAARAPAGGPKRVVAVFTIEDRGAKLATDVQERLSDYLASTLAASGKFQVIPRSQLKERLGLQRTESYKECYDQSCQIELGKELAAEKTLSTQVIRLGATCSVTSVIYDLKTAASESGATHESGCSEDEISRALKAVVAKLTGAM
ncbi:MAG TPA: hypothetical protein PK668_09920 [Myxococcota bacterium]|nr:hypothetical protein [Myxococcota bacterium]HRY93518.1 hypothetical protein [Myxococcota bacterium]HSA23711.1 hypothetical protein [Myxococcota bacterium]